jgi:type III secretion protein J
MRPRFAPGLLLVLVLALSGCSVELQHGLTEQDANDIYVLLTENGISAKKSKEEGGAEGVYLISVPKQDAAAAAKLLREHSLPRPLSSGFSDITKHKGMIPTGVEERAMFLDALSGEIARGLNDVDGVLEAHVIVQIPERNDLSQPDKKPIPTASALIRYRVNMDGKPPLDELQVKRFVSGAVEDLHPEQVNVIMSQAQMPAPEVNSGSRLQDIMGLRMTASSASAFKLMAAIAALLILVMTGLTTWHFVRSGGLPFKLRGERNPEQ